MSRSHRRAMILSVAIPLLGIMSLYLLTAPPAVGHGGKPHAEAFTAFQALGKGAELYDRLILAGKLDESWETDLKRVHIDSRSDGAGQREVVVRFERTSGEPDSVFFFFDQTGAYSGSNFTGE